MNIEARLTELGIVLPEAAAPVASYLRMFRVSCPLSTVSSPPGDWARMCRWKMGRQRPVPAA